METFLQQLKALSSAEDFLQYFGVPFDQQVVNVSRLHKMCIRDRPWQAAAKPGPGRPAVGMDGG